MEYQTINQYDPIARKEHRCIWCPEKITKGERHHVHTVVYDGTIESQRWHTDFRDAARQYFQEYGERDFEPHSCKRGTNEEARECASPSS